MVKVENAEIESSILESQVSDLPAHDFCLELGKLHSQSPCWNRAKTNRTVVQFWKTPRMSVTTQQNCTNVQSVFDLKIRFYKNVQKPHLDVNTIINFERCFLSGG